jgi:hypothetical protein
MKPFPRHPARKSRYGYAEMKKSLLTLTLTLTLILTLAAVACRPALAGTWSTAWPDADSALDLSGFGTFGLASTNTDAAQFIRYNQARGTTSGITNGTDSNLGLQAIYKFSPAVSATVAGAAPPSPSISPTTTPGT